MANEFQKSAKSIVAFVFAAATAVISYGDLIPLNPTLRGILSATAVFITAIAVWAKKNAPLIEAGAKEVDSIASDLGIKIPDLQVWATEALGVLGTTQTSVVVAVPVEHVAPVDPLAAAAVVGEKETVVDPLA